MLWNDKLKSLRGNKTIEEVATDMSLSPTCYAAYESGERVPLPSVKKDIAKYFGVTVEDIWG